MPAHFAPEGFRTVTPYLTVKDAARAIPFYARAFGAKEIMRLTMPDGKIGHAEMRIGDSPIMLADVFPEWGRRSPQDLGGSPMMVCLFVPDADAMLKQAVDAGAKVLMPLTNQFYGDRTAWIRDPSGHVWTVATRIEETTEEERKRRLADILAKSKPGAA